MDLLEHICAFTNPCVEIIKAGSFQSLFTDGVVGGPGRCDGFSYCGDDGLEDFSWPIWSYLVFILKKFKLTLKRHPNVHSV